MNDCTWFLHIHFFIWQGDLRQKKRKSKIFLNCYGRGWTEWTDGRGIRRGSTKLNQQILTSSGLCDQIWEGTSKAWLVKRKRKKKMLSYIRIWIPLIPTMRCMGKTLRLFDRPPRPGPNIERTKLSPKPQQCPQLCNHLKWKSRYSFINNTDHRRWKYLRWVCHAAFPPMTKQRAGQTRSENCCFAMQTQRFLRIRAVSLGKTTVVFFFSFLRIFSHELQYVISSF